MPAWLAPLLSAFGNLAAKLLELGLAFLAGKRSRQADDLSEAVAVRERQAKAAAGAPKGKDELLERLRKHGL
ncbi:MAG: hypothetical protein ACOY3L_03740 [Pseudomonadota bacterium]